MFMQVIPTPEGFDVAPTRNIQVANFGWTCQKCGAYVLDGIAFNGSYNFVTLHRAFHDDLEMRLS